MTIIGASQFSVARRRVGVLVGLFVIPGVGIAGMMLPDRVASEGIDEHLRVLLDDREVRNHHNDADPALSRFFSGLLRPTKIRILGMEFAGTVEAVGESVTKFRPGDPVFGSTGFFTMGAHAEYVRVSENGMVTVKPTNMQFEEAAAVLYGGVAAVHFLKQAKIKPGQNVLIYGASGSVGVFAVQLAKHFGGRVTGVCSNLLQRIAPINHGPQLSGLN